MRRNIVVLLVGLSVGCQNIHKLPGFASSMPAPDTSPTENVVQYSGVTIFDNQIIENIRTTNCIILVRVKRPGEDWQECNSYEIRIDRPTSGLGDVWFLKQVIIDEGLLTLTGKPVAPTGTAYQITSRKRVLTAQ